MFPFFRPAFPPAVPALVFRAFTRVQLSLSLVDSEVGVCVATNFVSFSTANIVTCLSLFLFRRMELTTC